MVAIILIIAIITVYTALGLSLYNGVKRS